MRQLPFRLQESFSPPFEMKAEWNLEQLMGYLNSWSAVQRFKDVNDGTDPLDCIRPKLAAAWGDRTARKQVTWPPNVTAWLVNAT
jgi:hypothetical protein